MAIVSEPHSNLPAHARDVHSFSNPSQVRVTHLDLDLSVNFDHKTLSGAVILDIERIDANAPLKLDTHSLNIKAVLVDDGNGQFGPASFHMAPPSEEESQRIFGQALTVELPPKTRRVKIEYETSPGALALQWLSPAQTSGKLHPFFYSQGYAIYTRSWVPCQDSPLVRFTYDARIQVPPELRAVMSASNQLQRSATGRYEFHMPQPLPSYLMALAVGDLEFQATGPRTGVFSEPSLLTAAAWEFADAEAMVQAAEGFLGAYQWDRFDILVMPPSFPYGGMENPRLTFVNGAAVMDGKRSNVNVIAHELAHSWAGNLVGNATFNGDFWLNEGITTYVERLIQKALYGEDAAQMSAALRYLGLREFVDKLGHDHPDTRLAVNGEGRDPDDLTTLIPYEKGYLFLLHIESVVGLEPLLRFLKNYFSRFAFQNMTTDRFLGLLRAEFVQRDAEVERALNIQEWVYSPGLPATAPQIESRLVHAVNAAIEEFSRTSDAADVKNMDSSGWIPNQYAYFIQTLPTTLTSAQMVALDERFHFTDSTNVEILYRWLLRAIQSNYGPGLERLEPFLTQVGRGLYVKPLYEALAQTPEGLVRGLRALTKAQPLYHAAVAASCAKHLGLDSAQNL